MFKNCFIVPVNVRHSIGLGDLAKSVLIKTVPILRTSKTLELLSEKIILRKIVVHRVIDARLYSS